MNMLLINVINMLLICKDAGGIIQEVSSITFGQWSTPALLNMTHLFESYH